MLPTIEWYCVPGSALHTFRGPDRDDFHIGSTAFYQKAAVFARQIRSGLLNPLSQADFYPYGDPRGGWWISYERRTPVGSKEVWGKLLNSIHLQGGEIVLWFRTEVYWNGSKRWGDRCWRCLVFEKVLDLLPRHMTPYYLDFVLANCS